MILFKMLWQNGMDLKKQDLFEGVFETRLDIDLFDWPINMSW